MGAATGKGSRRPAGMSSLDDFGVVDDTRTRYRAYASAASRLNPRERAAWWRDVLRRDPDMLKFINGDEKGRAGV